MKKNIFKFCAWLALLVFMIIGYGFLNAKYSIGIPCFLNKFFGIYCPGCGLTRAGVAMLRLDFNGAVNYNAFSVILLPLLFVVLVAFFWECSFNKPSFISKIPIWFWCILFGIVTVYGFARNFIPELQPVSM